MRSIKVLPESVRSCMRSGIILFDLTRVVEELVFNSLDAGAAKVMVAVGVGTSYIKVTDNGCGVTRDGLVLLGERYATSKFEQLAGLNTVPESFGFRGEALSSISDVSLLEFVTKAHGMPNGYRKVIKGCKCLYLGIDDDRHDVGTTVVVRDLFYNQPVKRRHLLSSPKKVLHSVKQSILRISLVHPATYFKVIDIESGDELLSLYPSSSPLPILKSCFGIEVSHSLHKLDESVGELKLSGYISGPYETFSVKAFQYFYINSRYISRGPIHKLLNQLATTQSCSDLLKTDIISQCGKRSRSQASPTYILNLTCSRAHYDLSFEPAKTCVEFKDWDPVVTFIKKSVSYLWSQEDDIWNEADTLSTRDDPLNDYGLLKKRCMKRCNQELEMPRVEPKHTQFSKYSCNRSQKHIVQSEDYGYISSEDVFMETNEHMDLLSDAKWDLNNRLIVKKPSAVSFHFDDNDLMKPFLRPCSSLIDVSPVVKSTKYDNNFRFQADTFKKWLDMDDKVDNEEADYINQGSEPLMDDTVAIWSPPRITTACNLGRDSYLLSKGSFDLTLPGEDCLTEDNPVSSVQCDWSASRFGSPLGENMYVEPITDVVSKRQFKHSRNDEFDLFAFEEGEHTDIFNFNNMTDSSSWEDCKKNTRNSQNDSILLSQQCDFLNETDWAHTESFGKHETCIPVAESCHLSSVSYADGGKSKIDQYRYQDKQRRRSCSAPPFYRGKKKIVALNSSMTVNTKKSNHEAFRNAPTAQEASHQKNTQKPSGVDSANDLRSKARHDKKNNIDKAEISDFEEEGHCHDVYNTNSEASHQRHTQKPSGVDSANDLRSKARHDKKKNIDKADISDFKEEGHCHDVYNINSDITLKENHGALDFGVKWRNGCPLTSSTKKPDVIINQDSILDISSDKLHLSGDSLLPKSLSKKCLEVCRVLQQVDKKFIPIAGGGILAIIDQHAADERIRLEDLREKVLSGETKTITYLDAEQELVLPEIGYQLLKNYSEQIQKWGWICNFHAQSSMSFKKNLNFLHNQPSVATLIAVPCILGVSLNDVDLLEFLQQLADTDGSSVIPPAVLRILNFKACRGAIMFGDALLPSECSVILEELKQTSMCFQCAHGRPTTVPLVNLAVLHKQIAKLGKWSHGSSGPWHGLSRHRPSLERATQRSSQC